ncbi:hypothetical protein A5884_003663 [Enterococcus sp. 7D2_DIV0200]|uniref:hypothetical protein n=1 Tax=Enterococcus sp. 7D2_DIV0200 TaxID=1834187 RepID=UPI000A32CD31|nr:hypothetical protein [Enterococcus sp. 7D2_DIV0200]OTP47126.1 hypothetical protein A5884_003663 [Enterococcus sp. 7D2_DIV0200]
MKKLTKKQLGLIAAVVLLGVGGTYAYAQNQSSVKASEAKQEVKDTTKKLEDLNKEVAALYDTKDPDFLVKGIKAKQIKDLKEKMTKVDTIKKDKELSKKEYVAYDKEVKAVNDNLANATKKLNALVDINGLFQQTQTAVAINGSDVKKDLAIADDLKRETVEKVSKAYFKEGATKTYDKTINELLANAENQLNQIDKAKVEVAKVYKEGKVVSTDNKLYDTAKAETDKIKNEKAKRALSDQLDKVKTDIDKQATEDKAKADETTKAQAEATSNANPQANNTNAAQTSGTQGATGTEAAPVENGYTGNDGGYVAPEAPTNGGYTPPASNSGSTGGGSTPAPQAPSQPSNGGGGRGEMTQEDLNQAEKDAANADWSDFFPK